MPKTTKKIKPIKPIKAIKSQPKPKKTKKSSRIWRNRRFSRFLTIVIVLELGVLAWIGGSFAWSQYHDAHKSDAKPNLTTIGKPSLVAGSVISTQNSATWDAAQTTALIAETAKAFSLPIQSGVTKQIFSYQSSDARDDKPITVYGRIYVPSVVKAGAKLPVIAFAPGTTGIGDECAASLENATRRNWGNYDSLLAAYASQGYIVVTTDYEGMRDDSRLHHYMVGVQEGRAVLDSVRALKGLALTKSVFDPDKIAVAGYSQGGQAALWADKIAGQYASDVRVAAVIGFGPVSDVRTTLDDTASGSTIDWFGPYVLTSYADYYHQSFPLDQILLAHWTTSLKTDVMNSCIDTASKVWGTKPDLVYTPQFLQVMKSGQYTGVYQQLGDDMDANLAGDQTTPSAKLINQGSLDNVILPAQSKALDQELCLTNSDTTLTMYKNATHYNTMVTSFNDTLKWLDDVYDARSLGNCGAVTP